MVSTKGRLPKRRFRSIGCPADAFPRKAPLRPMTRGRQRNCRCSWNLPDHGGTPDQPADTFAGDIGFRDSHPAPTREDG
jgi:hypothetical protein